MTPADAQRISRVILHRDHGAFNELVCEYQSSVRRFLRNLTGGNDAFADDLAQETFVRAYEQIARFRGESSFSTWLFGIAYNQFRNARRRERTDTWMKESAPEIEPTGPTTFSSDLKADLTAALDELPPEQKGAISLCYQQGLSHEEIAIAMSTPLGTVKTNIARGKEKLRQLLSVWNPTL